MGERHAWEPHGYYATDSNIAKFVDRYGYGSYADLRPDTEAEIAEFWKAVEDDTGIVWDESYDTVLDTSGGVPFTKWFDGGRLNATRTIIDRWVEATPEGTALIWEGEDGDEKAFTYTQLQQRVDRLANAMQDHGITEGDTVAIVAPLTPRAIFATLACLKTGAIQTNIFAGYGVQAIAERLADCEPKLVFTTDGYRRNGNVYDLRTKVDEALADITSVSTAVTHAHVGQEGSASEVDERDWDSFVEGYDSPAETAVVDTDHPALIAYSSGTTGKPKGTIHTHVSLLTMGLKEGKYQFDLREGDTFLWITDYGWIVVPSWLVCGSIGTGAKTVLVGGAPTHQSGERLWDIVERRDVTTLGMSPTSARTLRQINDSPRENWDLSSLRILGSTGEPWDVETWNWVMNAVGNGHLPIVNDSGGTEVCGGLLSPTPLTSLEPGTLYGPAPGIPANVYDESGTPADEGYLVVEGPVPGMTRSLTGGDDRYLAEYWEDFEGVWNQNDWTYIDDDGFWYIEGRADDTMNVSGRRVTAPTIEGTILEHSAVDEAAVIGVVADDGGEQPVAFITLVSDATEIPDDPIDSVNQQVIDSLGAPFKLAHLHVVEEIPRTQTGKIPRGRIEAAYVDGDVPENVATLEHGQALESYPRQE